MTPLRPAVFLDKDGTLVEDVPYNVEPDRIRLTPGALDGLARLAACGFALVVISNQSGVARGLFAEAALEAVWDRLRALVAPAGVAFEAIHYCPHHPGGSVASYARECDCRKPAPGMIRRAAAERGLDLARSWMVGDILDDVEAGRRAGVRTVLIDNGNETEWALSRQRLPHHLAPDLATAARIIEAVDAGAGAASSRVPRLAASPSAPGSKAATPVGSRARAAFGGRAAAP